MQLRAPLISIALAVAVAAGASAQVYETPRPIATTTALPAIHSEAVARIVHERFMLGSDALARSDWARAEAEFQSIVNVAPPEPKGSTALYDLAIARAHLGENDAAAKSLRAAIALDPGFLAAMANLVAVDLARNDLSEARSVADSFVALAPDSARALYSRGLVALRTGDTSVARSDFSKLLNDDPSYAVAHYDLGVTEARIGAYAAAERDFAQALSLVPTYARARFALGTVLLRDRQLSDARNAFDRAAHDAGDDLSLRTISIEMRDAIAAP